MVESPKKRDVIEVFLNKQVKVVYKESSEERVARGVLIFWDMNFLLLKSSSGERAVSIPAILSIKEVDG